MAVRASGYARQARDEYNTPAWAVNRLVDYLEAEGWLPLYRDGSSKPLGMWECAAGVGQAADVFVARGYEVFATDIYHRPNCYIHDFLGGELQPVLMPSRIGGIFTNPPYKHADAFVERALQIMAAAHGIVAMLLPVDFDSANKRRPFFEDCRDWRRLKLAFLDRLIWFEQPDASESSSENHAWFIWKHEPQTNFTRGELAYVGMTPAEKRAVSVSKKARRLAWDALTRERQIELMPNSKRIKPE